MAGDMTEEHQALITRLQALAEHPDFPPGMTRNLVYLLDKGLSTTAAVNAVGLYSRLLRNFQQDDLAGQCAYACWPALSDTDGHRECHTSAQRAETCAVATSDLCIRVW